MANLWEKAKQLSIQTGSEIVGGFDVGIDERIGEDVADALMGFVYWVEDHFSMPVTLWVDFKYNHYLIDRDGKRAGYRFYWVDYKAHTQFDSFDDIPVIELAARSEKQTVDRILTAFIEAVSCYFAWLSGMDMDRFQPDKELTEEILAAYKNTLR